MKKIDELLARVNEVIIVHPYLPQEIFNPKSGGARLILEQIKFLRNMGYKVYSISLRDVNSLTSFLYY